MRLGLCRFRFGGNDSNGGFFGRRNLGKVDCVLCQFFEHGQGRIFGGLGLGSEQLKQNQELWILGREKADETLSGFTGIFPFADTKRGS